MKSALVVVATGLYVLLALAGCSVAMALHGTPEPNFKAFEVGSSRQQVEIQLGKPVASQPLGEGKKKDSYRFEIGNSPNGHRALMNFYIDLGTFGLWELPGTIVEAMMGHDEETRIIYDANDRSEEHTSELQSRLHLVCRLLLGKKKKSKCAMLEESTVTMCT